MMMLGGWGTIRRRRRGGGRGGGGQAQDGDRRRGQCEGRCVENADSDERRAMHRSSSETGFYSSGPCAARQTPRRFKLRSGTRAPEGLRLTLRGQELD